MTTVTLEEARANLPELFRRVSVGEELVVMDQGKCIGQLSPPPEPSATSRMNSPLAQRAPRKLYE